MSYTVPGTFLVSADLRGHGLVLPGVSIYSKPGFSAARRELRGEGQAETRESVLPFEGTPSMGKAPIKHTFLQNSPLRCNRTLLIRS